MAKAQDKTKAAKGNVWLTKNIPSLAKLLGVTAEASDGSRTTTAKKAARPKLPIVNLLPPRLELEKLRRSTRRGFAVAAILIILSTGFFWLVMNILNNFANSTLDSARRDLQSVTNQVNDYKAVQDYYADLAQRVSYIKTLEVNNVDYQLVTDTLVAALPANSSLQGMTITALDRTKTTGSSANLASQCGSPTDPFNVTPAEPLACLSFTGIVTDRRQIADIQVALQKSNILSNVSTGESKTGNATNAAGASISFSGSAVINTNAREKDSVLSALTTTGAKK